MQQSNDQTKMENIMPWLVILAASSFFFYEFIQMNMMSSLAPYLMRDFSLNAHQLGNLSAAYFYSAILFLLPAGQILDRFSTRKIILISLAICVAGTFLFALAKNYYLTLLCRFLAGIGSSFCFLSCVRLISRWFSSDRMALISGIVIAIAMFGGIVAQTPMTILINFIGNWRHAVLIDSFLGLIFLFIIYITIQDSPFKKSRVIQSNNAGINQISYWQSMKLAYLKTHNWLCGIYTCFMNLPIYLIGGGGFGALYLEQTKHLSTLQASYPPMMIFFGTLLGSPFVGLISDSISRRKLPMQIGAVLSIIFISAIIFLKVSLSTYMILFFLLGIISSTQIIGYPTVAENNPIMITASSVSVVSFTTLSGGAIFQPLFGYIMDKAGNFQIINNTHIYDAQTYQHAMLIMPITMCIALMATVYIKETFCKSNY